MSQLGPISLCNIMVKIVCKVLANRLQPILMQIISETQSVFLPGCIISDNILITHELLHYLNTNKKGKDTSMSIKLDMSKAYDRVEWCFLEAIMRKLGFSETWIKWVMMCLVTSISYNF
ncbi:hypothetical protein LIER_34628 [Lithospermum erythrorhizon]|uniref:Reverse transcriptase domain-containing protein n=1 Tax=Lithospermum erythrorhizon TaxID=34254 RepID=A0AAV3S321_LITER